MQTKYMRYGYKRHGPGGPALRIAALLLMLAAPLAMAGIDCDKRPDHPSCGGSVYTPVDVEARYVYDDGIFYEMEQASPWEGPYPQLSPPELEHHPWYSVDMFYWDDFEENTLEAIPRPCAIGGTSEFPPYICNDPDYRGGRLSIDMSVALGWQPVEPVKKKDIPLYCELLSAWSNGSLPTFGGQPLTFGVTWYALGYIDNSCDKEPLNCNIWVSAQSLRPGLNPFVRLPEQTGYPLPDVDSIRVHGVLDQDWIIFPDGFPDSESNLFTLPQLLPLERLEIQFAAGSKRAACETTFVTPETIWLVTEPLPPPPEE